MSNRSPKTISVFFAVVAIADKADKDGNVFTRDCLRRMAGERPQRFRFDEESGKLIETITHFNSWPEK